MKSCNQRLTATQSSVAPLAGAWIEIDGNIGAARDKIVAPLAGAWIEIQVTKDDIIGGYSVAPLAGAWIEI